MNIRNCRVIVCCFLDGRSARNNSPTSKIECLNLIKETILIERDLNSDVSYDLIIINHDTNYVEGNSYLESINNSRIKNGFIKVVTTENKGLSFDGFNTAFEMFMHNYDYWIFTEDDHIIFHENYFHKLLEEFNSNKKNGFLSLAPKSKSQPEHSGGGFGITSTENLKKIYDKLGSLPCLRTKGSSVLAEIYFTHEFVQNDMSIIENKTFCLSPINIEKCKDHQINLKDNDKNLPYLYRVGL